VWIQTTGGQVFPPVFTDEGASITNPLFQYSLPLVTKGDIANNWGMVAGLQGLLSFIPLFVVVGGINLLVPRWLNRREQRQEVKSQPVNQAAGGID
jgi:hypothetical protein